jgi:predicted transcriptional regulator
MSRRKDVPPPAGRKRTIKLSAETSTRLGVEAERRRSTRSAVAEAILADGLRHIVVQIRTREPAQEDAA